MRWTQKWLGLKLWAACWLLVLLLPNWRQDAREQWDSENWKFDASTRGLTPERTALLAARFPTDFAAHLEQLSAQYPYVADESLAKNAARQKSFFDDYAGLSRRFPRQNAIRQAWLLDAMRGGLNIEPAALYADIPPQNRPKPQQNWLSQAQLEAGIGAAREGAKVEPQNSFFPWMESALWFALGRPDDALAALNRAANCAYFEDGTTETVRRRIELLGRVQNLSWSDQSHAMWSLLLPHLSRIRASARAAMKMSRQAHQGGDKLRALQIAATVARAGATVSASKGSLITVLVGDAIQQIAWRGAILNAGRDIKRVKYPDPSTDLDLDAKERVRINQARQQEVAQKVAIYARELKQEAVAEQALATLPHLKGNRLSAAYIEPAFDGAFQGIKRLDKAFWLQARLMRLSLLGALVWAVAFALSLGRAIAPEIRRPMASWAAFCVGATAVLLGVGVVYFGLGSMDGFFLEDGEPISSYARDYQAGLNGFLALLWIFPIVLSALLAGIVRRPQWKLERRGFSARRIVQMLIYGAIVGSIAAIFLADSVGFDSFWGQIWPAPPLVLIGSILVAGAFHVVTTSGKTRIASLLFWSVPWILGGALTARYEFLDTFWAVFIFAIALIFLGLSAYLTHWRPARPTLRSFFDVMGRVRILAATLAVASALFYLGIRIAALPDEARMGALVTAQVKMGEVAWLEKKLES